MDIFGDRRFVEIAGSKLHELPPLLVRGTPAKTFEGGLNERTVVSEWPSLKEAIAAYESPAYKEALRALGNGAERDIRIVEGAA